MTCFKHHRRGGSAGLLLAGLLTAGVVEPTHSAPRAAEPPTTADPTTDRSPDPSSLAVNPIEASPPMDEDHSANPPPQSPLTAPIATDQYWDAMARCETNTRWHRDTKWGGGLGIYLKTWKVFGGLEFAPRAGLASRLDQIEVANRIATLGYTSPSGYHYKPIGYHAWGCALRLTPPTLIWHRTEALLAEAVGNALTADHAVELRAALGVAETDDVMARAQAVYERYQRQEGFDDLGNYKPRRTFAASQLRLAHLKIIGHADAVAPSDP